MLAPSPKSAAPESEAEEKISRHNMLDPPVAVALIFGAIDSLVPFSYIFNIYPYINYWHAATLAVKLLICCIYYKYISISRVAVLSALVLTSIILISSVPSGSQFADYAKIFGFVTHVFITLTMIRRDNLPKYMLASVGVLFASTLIYLVAAKTGHIDTTFGRYSYFHHTHPNLGSEIIAMSIVLAACVLGWVPFLIVTLPSLYAIYLMEGRAALVVALITIGAKLVYEQWRNKKRLALILGGLAGAGLLALLVSDKAGKLLNSAFLLHDKYRGIGSGFVGRDQLWNVAWHWFMASPIIGNGAGFFDRYGVEIHNFFFVRSVRIRHSLADHLRDDLLSFLRALSHQQEVVLLLPRHSGLLDVQRPVFQHQPVSVPALCRALRPRQHIGHGIEVLAGAGESPPARGASRIGSNPRQKLNASRCRSAWRRPGRSVPCSWL